MKGFYIRKTNMNNEMENKIIKNVIEWSFCFIFAILLAVLIRYYLLAPARVKQNSMYPILKENQRIVLNRTNRISNKEYKRGDIVTFEAPSEESLDISNQIAKYDYNYNNLLEKIKYNILEIGKTSYIKRIIAVAGDKIEIKDGIVYLNDKELEETYLPKDTKTYQGNYNCLEVPEDCVFVMGDNRNSSIDSRTFGCIPINKIEGIVCFRYWPLNEFGKINKKEI